jgi:hypothetical protein
MRIQILSAATMAVAVSAGLLIAGAGPSAVSVEAQGGLPYRIALGQIVRDGTNATNQAGYVTSARGERNGNQVSIEVTVRSRAADTVVIDIETYDSVGRRIDQQWVDNVSFGTNQERTFEVSFTPPAGAPGPFVVKVGLFEPGPYWGLLLHWNNEAATIP